MPNKKVFSTYSIEIQGDVSSPFALLIFNKSTPAYTQLLKEHPLLLIFIESDNWFDTYSPWPHEKIMTKGTAFGGKADEFLSLLEKELLPYLESQYQLTKKKIILAGYSLSGLFSLYAASKSKRFTGIVSASGSLWYPGFIDYLKTQEVQVDNIYLSIGDKESETKNPYLSQGLSCHFSALDLFNKQGKNVILDINPGGHFLDEDKRISKGIDWLIENFKE